MQYIPTPFTGKTSDNKTYSYGKCPHCGTSAKHEKLGDYIVCVFCNKNIDEQSFFEEKKPSPPKCSSYPARYRKQK